MPYLFIQTNAVITAPKKLQLMQKLSQAVAEMLGKPEQYVMVAIQADVPMFFAGSEAPTAYLALKSIGLPESTTTQISASLCQIINEALSIPTNRIYLEFTDAPRKMWGWDKRTF